MEELFVRPSFQTSYKSACCQQKAEEALNVRVTVKAIYFQGLIIRSACGKESRC